MPPMKTRMILFGRAICICVVATFVASSASVLRAEPTNTARPERTFVFTYAATVTGLKPGQVARVWLPVPQTSADQTVEIIDQSLPGKPQLGKETKWGNQILFTEAPARDDGT